MDESESLCTLQQALGQSEHCSGARCPFWDEPGGCVLSGVAPEFRQRPDIAAYLLDLRHELGMLDDRDRLRLAQLLNQEQEAEG